MALISNGTTIFDAGAMASGFGGDFRFIKKLTASSSSTLEFVDGSSNVVLDNTFKEYVFHFVNLHPQTDNVRFQFNMSVDGGSNYNVTKTTTVFETSHKEDDSESGLGYSGRTLSEDLAQSTSFQNLTIGTGNDNDQNFAGKLTLFDPSDTTFVKHFLSDTQSSNFRDSSFRWFVGGYGNTTSAVNAVQFKFDSGNIDSGDILLFGVN